MPDVTASLHDTALEAGEPRRSVPRWVLRAALVALIVTGWTEVLWQLGALQRAEWLLADVGWGLAPLAPRDPPVTLVTLDDASLEAHPEPLVVWSPLFARVIERLRAEGASVVGVDFLFAATAESWLKQVGFGDDPLSRSFDAPLLAQVYSGDVVLTASLRETDDGGFDYDRPHPAYQAVLPDRRSHVGITFFPVDSDGVMRRLLPVVLHERDEPALSFALALALAHTGQSAHADTWELGGRTLRSGEVEPVEIAWLGPPGSVPELPFWRLLDDTPLTEAERSMIRDRVVIVGADYAQSGDRWFTPWSRTGHRSMTGHELQAHMVASLLDGSRVTHPGMPGRLLLLLAVSLAMSVATFRLTPQRAALALAGVACTWLAVAWGAFAGLHLVLPVAAGLVAAVAVYAVGTAVRFDRASRRGRVLRSLFERYVSDAVVGDLLTRPDSVQLGGRRLEVTVLFTDIRGFTTLSELLSPEEVVVVLNEFYSVVTRPILDNGGLVDKFIGDAVMGVFGAPVTTRDHARRAVQATVEIMAAMDGLRARLAERFPNKDLPRFETGIGLHTGPVVAGNVGTERRTEYTVIGDTVNVASRIEGLTKQTGWFNHISQQALDAAGPGVVVGRTLTTTVRGSHHEIRVFELVGLEEDP